MIRRVYICDSCNHSLEVYQDLHDEKRLKKCPVCKKNKLYQDLTGQYHCINQEPKTLGHQAARNTAAMGKYELQEKRAQDQSKYTERKLNYLKEQGVLPQDATSIPEGAKTWYNPEGKNLKKELKEVVKDRKKTKRYIEKGEK